MDLESLRKHSLFGGIALDALKRIQPLLKERDCPAGEFVVREGDHGGTLFFISGGSVEILKHVPGSADDLRRLAVLGVGDTFGEMEVIDIQCCAASVRALEDTTLLTLTNSDMYRIYEDNVETFALILMNMAREISRRLRRMDELMAGSLRMQRGEPDSGESRCGGCEVTT